MLNILNCGIIFVQNLPVIIPETNLSFLQFSARIQMSVDTSPGGTLSRNLPPDVPTPLPLENMYIAGIPSSVAIPLQVPVLASFNGDIKHVQVNGDTLFDGR